MHTNITTIYFHAPRSFLPNTTIILSRACGPVAIRMYTLIYAE
jgi:hypothetical protein